MRKLLIVFGVVLLVLIAVDRGAKYLVESTLADHIASTERASDAEVNIGGFPFLTQVLRNHFDEIDVSISRVDARSRSGSLEVEDVEVSLRDVETSHRFTQATAASATGSGLVPYSAFDQFAPVQVGYGGTSADGTGYLTVSAPTLGPGSIRVAPSAADGLTFQIFTALTRALPSGLRSFVAGSHQLAGLPPGLRIKSLEATEDGLRVILVGSDVRIAR